MSSTQKIYIIGMMPSVSRVAFEALLVGIVLVIIFRCVSELYKYKTNQSLLINVGLSGALFHILGEVSGLNRWYSTSYK